jgi:hypothetical protein
MMLHDYLYGDAYGNDNDNNVFYAPSHEYYRWKRQEELRRRWELEQAYRREQHERYVRNLRRREEQERQMRRRRELELRDVLAEQDLLDDNYNEGTKQGAQPKYQLVRGIDGLIYRVPIRRTDQSDGQNLPSLRRPTVEKEPPHLESKDASEDLSHTPELGVSRNNTTKQAESKITSNGTPDEEVRGRVVVDVRVPEAKGPKKGRNRRKMTVVVEDASDSEGDKDEFKSVWRNRRPSPGQWIEPVDF